MRAMRECKTWGFSLMYTTMHFMVSKFIVNWITSKSKEKGMFMSASSDANRESLLERLIATDFFFCLILLNEFGETCNSFN